MQKTSTILITGGAGFIGSNLAEELLKKEYRVIVFDHLSTGSKKNVAGFRSNPGFTLIKGNANNHADLKNVFNAKAIDYVFHYAAVVGVDRTLAEPLSVFEDIDGLKNILNLSIKAKVKRFFFSSSSEIYGEPYKLPLHEYESPYNARLPYAVIKSLGEVLINAYQEKYGLNYTIFRFFNTYGPRQSDDFVMSKFIHQALENKDLIINGKGDQTRTFMYIADNVKATVNALASKQAANKIVNIGNNQEITIYKLAELIVKLTGSKSGIVHRPARKQGEVSRRVPDITLMQKILNIKKLTSLEDGLRKTINYIKELSEK